MMFYMPPRLNSSRAVGAEDETVTESRAPLEVEFVCYPRGETKQDKWIVECVLLRIRPRQFGLAPLMRSLYETVRKC